MKNKAPLYVAIAIVGSVAFNINSITGQSKSSTATASEKAQRCIELKGDSPICDKVNAKSLPKSLKAEFRTAMNRRKELQAERYATNKAAKEKKAAENKAFIAKYHAENPHLLEEQIKPNRRNAIAACEIQLERTLRDPGSVRYDRSLTQYAVVKNRHQVALVYNAKNGFGGYAGQDIYTCTFK